MKSIYQNQDIKRCLFCDDVLNYSVSWNENRSYCLYKTPDCCLTYNNFMRSIKKAKKSKLLINQRIARWAEEKITEGFSPKQVKPIYDYIRKNRTRWKPKLIKNNDV